MSRRWHPVLWLNCILMATAVLVEVFAPGPIQSDEPIRNQLGIEAAAEFFASWLV